MVLKSWIALLFWEFRRPFWHGRCQKYFRKIGKDKNMTAKRAENVNLKNENIGEAIIRGFYF